MTGVFIKRKERFEHTDTLREEDHVHVGAETGMMQPEAKELQGLPGTPGAGRGLEQIPPQSLQKEPTLPTAWLQTSGLLNCERINFCCSKPPGLWCFVTAVLEN